MQSSQGIFYRTCNFCGSGDFAQFRQLEVPFPSQIYGDSKLTRPDVGQRLRLAYLECAHCGLLGVNPLPHFADVNRPSFDGERNIVAWADNNFESYEEGKRDLARFYRNYFRLDDFRQTNRILDVSCGPGVALDFYAREYGWQVTGVDPDRHSVRTARERYGLTLVNGLIGALDDSDESFDVVMLDNSLEHTFDPLGTLLDAYRLLRKGGALLIAVPNGEALSVRYLDWHMYWGHWFLYTPRGLCRRLQTIGFELAKLQASQPEISPELRQVLPSVDDLHLALDVRVSGEAAIDNVLSLSPCFADYFIVLAVKPPDAPTVSSRQERLRTIAEASLVEHAAVNLLPRQPRAIEQVPLASLEARLIQLRPGSPGEDGRVFLVEKGMRRWVTRRDLIEAMGYRFPVDALPVSQEIFAQFLDGPAIEDHEKQSDVLPASSNSRLSAGDMGDNQRRAAPSSRSAEGAIDRLRYHACAVHTRQSGDQASSRKLPPGVAVRARESVFGERVYFVTRGRRHWINDNPWFRQHGLVWPNDVRDISGELLASFLPGGPAPGVWSEEDVRSPPAGLAFGALREIAGSRLRGTGIEFGAGASPFPVPLHCRVLFADRLDHGDLTEELYRGQMKEDLVDPDIETDFESCANIGEGSVDFMIACHVIEHTRNPIGAIVEAWKRLRPGGSLVLAVPARDRTFDRERPITALSHLIEDFESPQRSRDYAHYEDFYARALPPFRQAGAEYRKTVDARFDEQYAIHYHVWTHESFLEMVDWIRRGPAPFASVWSHPGGPDVDRDIEFYAVMVK